MKRNLQLDDRYSEYRYGAEQISASKLKMNRRTSVKVEGAHLISGWNGHIVMFASDEFSAAAVEFTSTMVTMMMKVMRIILSIMISSLRY